MQVIGVFHGLGITQGYGSLDGARSASHAKPQPFGGISLQFDSRLILSLDHYRGAARRDDQNVCVAARIVGEGLGVLGAGFTARHHPPQQLARALLAFGSVWRGILPRCPIPSTGSMDRWIQTRMSGQRS